MKNNKLRIERLQVLALGRYLSDEEIKLIPAIKTNYDMAVLTYGDLIIDKVNRTDGAYLLIDERVGYSVVGNFSAD